MSLGAKRLLGGEILVEDFGVTKVITLSREKALNALSWPMVTALQPLYEEWIAGSSPCAIVLKGAGSKAFCAGGDVVGLAKDQPKGTRTHFFKEEYELNHTIGSLEGLGIPHVALVDGICMGGGVGVSVHGSTRVCTEATLFAMPECGLGLFPDVGGSVFLPRLAAPGLGEYLALTGRRLKGPDVVLAGIGTHYVPRSKMESLNAALHTATSTDHIHTIVDTFSEKVDPTTFSLKPDALKVIEEAFSYSNTVEAVLEVLRKTAETSESQGEFAAGLVADIVKGSPTSLKVTLQQMRKGKQQTTEQNYRMEYRISQGFMNLTNDFNEGVRAALIDKTGSPKWDPPTLELVTDAYVNTFFETVPKSGDLNLKPRKTSRVGEGRSSSTKTNCNAGDRSDDDDDNQNNNNKGNSKTGNNNGNSKL
eukprot:PhM_4_TR7225/c0_g1_i1/m.79115/K05605/HIBCH; 3-hydroxyisobutyryl-CoA hydrolase